MNTEPEVNASCTTPRKGGKRRMKRYPPRDIDIVLQLDGNDDSDESDDIDGDDDDEDYDNYPIAPVGGAGENGESSKTPAEVTIVFNQFSIRGADIFPL